MKKAATEKSQEKEELRKLVIAETNELGNKGAERRNVVGRARCQNTVLCPLNLGPLKLCLLDYSLLFVKKEKKSKETSLKYINLEACLQL